MGGGKGEVVPSFETTLTSIKATILRRFLLQFKTNFLILVYAAYSVPDIICLRQKICIVEESFRGTTRYLRGTFWASIAENVREKNR